MGVTIHDVAHRAGVSISTVSRVLNNTCPVRAEKREAVLEAAAALGYTPNPAARSLLKQKTGGLGVLLPSIVGEFFSELLNGIDHIAQEAGYFLLISTSHWNEAELQAALQVMNKRVDGLLIMAPATPAERLRAALPDVPVVFINTEAEAGDLDTVNFDNATGERAATRHLIDLGHRAIAIITGPAQAWDAQDRLSGFRMTLEEKGLELPEAWVQEGDFTQEGGMIAMRTLLNLPERPTAVVAGNDLSALGAIAAIREAGLRVPEDISIVGFDDVPSVRYTVPALTTVRIPIREMGMQAIRRLLERIDAPEPLEPLQQRLAVELIVRDSTGPVPAPEAERRH